MGWPPLSLGDASSLPKSRPRNVPFAHTKNQNPSAQILIYGNRFRPHPATNTSIRRHKSIQIYCHSARISTYSNTMGSATPKKKCGVLGCTGSVGQRFILLLADHPGLSLHALGASSRSAGKKYKDAARWKQSKPMSSELANLEVRECKAGNFQDCDLVFSGLDSDVAGDIGMLPLLHRVFNIGMLTYNPEREFWKADIPVFSNAKNYRRNPVVPLVVPTVNLSHIDLIPPTKVVWTQERILSLQF
jgi:hypothetical protein